VEDVITALWLVVLAFTHATDYLTFVRMVLAHGIAAEANPIVVLIATELGVGALTLAKASAVLLIVSTVVVVQRTRPRMAWAAIAAGIAAGTVGTVSNLATTGVYG
jgi:hypothetical protein